MRLRSAHAKTTAIIEELTQDLEYIQDGVLPNIADDDARDAWFGSVQTEQLWDPEFGTQATTQ